MNLKAMMFQPQLLIMITLFASIVTIGTTFGFIDLGFLGGSISGGEYIEAPYYATISCVQSGVSKDYENSISKSGQWISDNLPSNTNEWSLRLRNDESGFWSCSRQFEYSICNSKSLTNCNEHKIQRVDEKGDSISLGTISSSKFVHVQYQSNCGIFGGTDGKDGGRFEVTYKPFKLQRTDRLRGGVTEVAGAEACLIPSGDIGWNSRVKSGDVPDGTISSYRALNVGESFNYISGSVTRISNGNVQDGGYCIYNNDRASIYKVSPIETANGNFNVVDTSNVIGTAQCCNGDNLPDKTCVNGNWESTVEAECSIFNACEGTDWRRDLNSDKTIIKYSCVSGQCQASTKAVECSEDSDCLFSNERCNPGTWQCEKSSVEGDAGTFVAPLDNAGCVKAGGEWIAQKETKSGGLFGIGGETVVVDAHCKLKGESNILLTLSIIFVIVFLLFFFKPILMVFRNVFAKMGVKI